MVNPNTTWLIYACFGSYVAISASRWAEMRGAVSIGRIVAPADWTREQIISAWQAQCERNRA